MREGSFSSGMMKYALGWKPEPGCSDCCADHAEAAITPAATPARTEVKIARFMVSSLGFFFRARVVHFGHAHKAEALNVGGIAGVTGRQALCVPSQGLA